MGGAAVRQLGSQNRQGSDVRAEKCPTHCQASCRLCGSPGISAHVASRDRGPTAGAAFDGRLTPDFFSES